MAHLSAESALYNRIFTEGILGIVATGFRSFDLKPNIPDEWDYFNLNHIRAFGSNFDIRITRTADELKVLVFSSGELLLSKELANGETVHVELE
jgi:cellobiose phosphorylase